MSAGPVCLSHAWKKAGSYSGAGPRENKHSKLVAVKKRHKLDAVRKFSSSQICNGSSALVVPKVEIRQNLRTKRRGSSALLLGYVYRLH